MDVIVNIGEINWELLAQQKKALLDAVTDKGTHQDLMFLGLINLLDYLQDDAEEKGHPVVWLQDNDA